MLNDEVDKVTERFFKSLMRIHQNKLEESMKGSEFVLDNVHLSKIKKQQKIPLIKKIKNYINGL